MSLFHHYEPCERCRSNGNDRRGDNLAVYVDGSKYCFSCHYHYNPPHFYRWKPVTSIKEIYNGPKSLLPTDFQREVPRTAWEWLLQYGLPYTYWKESVGYSETHQRLVFRVGEPLQFSIGRYFGKDDHRKWHVWGDAHKHCELVRRCEESSSIVLVEDLISAHKVAHINECIPLFGTSLYQAHLYHLINQSKNVVLWLDKDQEQNVKREVNRLQSILTGEVKSITTPKDPKSYSIKEINEILN